MLEQLALEAQEMRTAQEVAANSQRAVYKGKNIVGTKYNKVKPTQTEINPERVQHYVNKLNKGEPVAPVQAVNVPNKGKFFIEGHHRFVASKLTNVHVDMIEMDGAGPVGMSDWSETEWLQWDGSDLVYK